MKNENLEKGQKICEEIFYRTGDIRYFNMAKGFEKLSAAN